MNTDRLHSETAPICVIGAGTMGRGIAQVAIAAGHRVSVVDPDEKQLTAAAREIESRLLRKMPDVATVLQDKLSMAVSVTDVTPAPDTVVVEAAVERLAVKQSILTQAFEHFGAGAILATNTSSLSITEIASGTPDPTRVVGMHFFNPVPLMRLVEVVTGLQTDGDVADTIAGLASAWGKDVARVRSAPGFIVNRVARPFYGEALKLLEEGAASAEVIDQVLRSAGGFRMGPFELVDLIGTDVNFTVTSTVWEAFNFDPRFAPSQVQRELVAAQRFGRKTGHGFYRYDSDGGREVPTPAGTDSECPTGLTLRGKSAQLQALVERAGAGVQAGEPSAVAAIEIPGLGYVSVTGGRTAAEEAIGRRAPVALLDRCLDPENATALAFSCTDPDLADAVVALLKCAGIEGFAVRDTPGLIVARVVSMLINEAHETALHGVASPADIDTAMVLGTNYPVGPFEWCARWTPDVPVEILDAVWAEYHDPRYRVSAGLRAARRAARRAAVTAGGQLVP